MEDNDRGWLRTSLLQASELARVALTVLDHDPDNRAALAEHVAHIDRCVRELKLTLARYLERAPSRPRPRAVPPQPQRRDRRIPPTPGAPRST